MRVPDHVLGLLIAGAILAFVVLHVLGAGANADLNFGRREPLVIPPNQND